LALVAASVVGLSLVLVACSKTVTHEPGASYPDMVTYDGGPPPVVQEGGATYQTIQQTAPGSPNAYAGTWHGKITSGNATNEQAAGILNADVPYGYEGYYGAAFYFPTGSLRPGSNPPTQSGDDYLLRWDNATTHPTGTNFGGIRLSADNRVELVKEKGGAVTTIGEKFSIREGCWNHIAVKQKIATDAVNAKNEVYLNGERIISASGVPNIDDQRVVDDVKFGYMTADSRQGTGLTYYIDNAAVGSTLSLPSPSQSNLCKPLPNVLFIVTDDQRAGSEDLVQPKTLKWFKNGASGIAGGTKFPKAYVSQPVCCPARSSIFTGQYPHNHGVTANGLAHPDDSLDPPEEDIPGLNQEHTVQRYLDDAGYTNAVYGKFLMEYQWWQPNKKDAYGQFVHDAGPSPATIKHFDDYGIFEGGYTNPGVRQPTSPGMPDYNGRIGSIPPDGQAPLPTYSTYYVREKGKRFLTKQAASEPGRPWFLYLAPSAPHETCISPDKLPDGTYDLATGQPRSGPNAWLNMTDGSVHAGDTFPGLALPANIFEDDVSDKPLHVRAGDDTGWGFRDKNCGGGQRRIFEKQVSPSTRYPGLREQQLRTLRDVDDLVEDIFQQMRSLGDEENTLAAYLSDNGYFWRDQSPSLEPGATLPSECARDDKPGEAGWLTGAWVVGDPRDPPLGTNAHNCGQSGKGLPYRGVTRIPFYIRWPSGGGLMPPTATDSGALASNIDLAPTAVDAAGETHRVPTSDPVGDRAPMDGRSLLTTGTALNRTKLLTEWPGETRKWVHVASLENGGYEYIAWYDPTTSALQWEEYYQLSDLGQATSLYDGSSGGSGEPAPPAGLSDIRTCVGTAGPKPCP
jgi:arylsulfatase A-like enzyme